MKWRHAGKARIGFSKLCLDQPLTVNFKSQYCVPVATVRVQRHRQPEGNDD